MKLSIIKTGLLGIFCLALISCEKSENRLISDVSPAGTLNSTKTTLDLSMADGDKPALVLNFTRAEVKGVIIPVESIIQFDAKGKNFANPVEYIQKSNSFSPTVNEINALMLKLGLKIGETGMIEVRLQSKPAANAVTYSNVITLSGIPYKASSWIYAPGAYQNWNPATADSLISSTSNGIYEGIINFPDTKLEFKITANKNWSTEYGDAGNNSFNLSGDNFSVLKAGIKKVIINMNTRKWEVSDAKTWSLIGSATPKGWDGDTDLKFINDGTETHTLTLDLLAGEFKIRYGHDWAVNVGGAVNDFTLNGGNVAVAAGNYSITLNVTKTDDTGKPTAVKITMVKN